MAQQFKKGDKVSWNAGQGEAVGTVEEYITEERTVEGQTVSASEDDPRCLVKNENTGNVTGHKPETLSKASSSSSSSSSPSNSKSSSSSSGASSGSSQKGDDFSSGDTVEWNTSQGKTQGKVVKKLTAETQIEGHTVKASKDDPQYLVESEKTGKQAAHKPSALSKV